MANSRRRVLAGAVTAVPALLILGSFFSPAPRVAAVPSAGVSASAATVSPTPLCLLTPTPTPILPLPSLPLCPTLPPLPTPTLPPLPTPTLPTLPSLPSLLPTSSPTPVVPGGGGGPGGTGPGGGTGGSSGSSGSVGSVGSGGSSTAPGAIGSGSTTGFGSVSATAGYPSTVAGRLLVTDPLFAAEVSDVLAHPLSAQRPDLQHFSIPGSNTSSALALAGLGIGGGGLPRLPAPIAALFLGAAGLAVAVIAIRAHWKHLNAVLAVCALAIAVPISAGAAVLAAQPIAPHHSVPPKAARPATAVAATYDRPSAVAAVSVPTNSPAFTTLLSIENTISAEQTKLGADEQRIASLNAMLAAPPSDFGGSRSLRPAAFLVLTSELHTAVAQHAALAATYQQSLQSEYDFFVATAKAPAQAASLEAAASSVTPAVKAAVVYDLNIVQTQLAQEAAIAGAQNLNSGALPSIALPSGPVTFDAPVSGVVTQPFGPTSFSLEPPMVYRGYFYPHFHTGLDIAAPLNTPVGAAAEGIVILATSSRDSRGNLVGYGNYVVIRHADGFMTLYGHLNRILVSPGQLVTQGQVIGLLGSTGWSTGPHVHFEIRINGMYVDPAPYIASQIHY